DEDMPRVQAPDYGATLRMVIAPGREAAGIFQMPGGEAGNPLSSHYGDLFDSWAARAAQPLLPGKPGTVLELVPPPAPTPRPRPPDLSRRPAASCPPRPPPLSSSSAVRGGARPSCATSWTPTRRSRAPARSSWERSAPVSKA